MKILNFGSCNIDYVYSMDHIVTPGETETTYSLETFPGGKGLNQSIAAARAGADVYHAGSVGNDGEFLRTILAENSVDVSLLKSIDATNGHAIIQVGSNGENAIFLYPGSNQMLTKEYVDHVLDHFLKEDILLLQNEVNYVDYMVEKAFEKGMSVVLNPSPFNEEISKIDFNKLSFVILNEVEARDISGCEEPEECLDFFKTSYPNLKIMLTLGANGSIYMDSVSKIYQPAFEVETVDTTAAGDTFTGFFVAGIAKARKMEETLKLASVAAAIAVSRKGAAPSIPSRKEAVDALESLRSNRTKSGADILLKKIEAYVTGNLKTANLRGLSECIGYSTVYAGSIVKKITGEPFSKYLNRKRCEIAAYKLRKTDLSVEEIIHSVGYENKNFFRKKFKLYFDTNPLNYRKNNADQF